LPYSDKSKRRANDLKNRDRLLEYRRNYYQKNKQVILGQNRAYRKRYPEKTIARTRRYAELKKDSIADYKKRYAEENRDRLRTYFRLYSNKRRVESVYFYLKMLLRTRLNQALRRKTKMGSAVRDVGCSIEELRFHLEKKFRPGMSWQNRGSWHVDHIVPLSKFNLTVREEFLRAVHFSNLQPLWAKENRIKSDR